MNFDQKIESDGYAIVQDVLEDAETANFIHLLSEAARPKSLRGGQRNLLSLAKIRALAESEMVMSLVRPVLGSGAFVVRGILFDKKEGSNWKVPWHQDVTIAVKERLETDGYGPWSMKEGVIHVQPPTGVLERMLSIRLHLDDCPASNGALKIIPKSHRYGKLDQNVISNFLGNETEIMCEVNRGGVLMMRPLAIHASSASEKPGHRRVIHFDFANTELAGGLEWFERR